MAGIAEHLQSEQAAADSGAAEGGSGGDVGDSDAIGMISESFYDGEAAGERKDEVGIAFEGGEIRHGPIIAHTPNLTGWTCYANIARTGANRALTMDFFLTLKDAVAEYVYDGVSVALEGFTHLIPFAAGHEIIRQGRRDLTLIRMTPDLLYDQMIGMGAARKLVFSWGGNPGVGSLHRLRDAVEKDWPGPLEIEEHSHAAMASAYEAGAAGLPCAFFRGYRGSDLARVNPKIKFVACPFTGEELACVPALRPDVTIIHAQRADREGNVMIEGIIGVQKEAVLAARCAIATVEEIVEDFGPRSTNAVILPAWTLKAVCAVPGGAKPSYAHGYYARDNAFYIAWDEISRERESFGAWMREHI